MKSLLRKKEQLDTILLNVEHQKSRAAQKLTQLNQQLARKRLSLENLRQYAAEYNNRPLELPAGFAELLANETAFSLRLETIIQNGESEIMNLEMRQKTHAQDYATLCDKTEGLSSLLSTLELQLLQAHAEQEDRELAETAQVFQRIRPHD
ncbi:hypothetical protein Lgee_1023 [Legionella geestiana]|uniref:Uncharacterized protein n=1 Tax=Legionella geestiana TaxID=45065 RepID=A0A0W0TXC3_9GAMM|nr:hypothetical protein [Legionella geestiana]KTD00111.1 hypothetical protein Lgee_1023 [Legionella geestiana]QBS11842.1 hypothetical protein E4T54_03255 [Legionella geestiana]QDQ40543.1 hypothetical protein E3226_009155 [Legionella geestiana]STX53462.1 Uncharacterised protein [Legionella geestiana]